MNNDEPIISDVTDYEANLLQIMATSVAYLVNLRIAPSLRGTDFAAGLSTGRSRIEIVMDFPSGELKIYCRHPDFDPAADPVFEVKMKTPPASMLQ